MEISSLLIVSDLTIQTISMGIEIRTFPLQTAAEIAQIQVMIHALKVKYRISVVLTESRSLIDPFIFKLHDNNYPKFNFQILGVRNVESGVEFQSSHQPTDEKMLASSEKWQTISQLEQSLDRWFKLLLTYNEIEQNRESSFEALYFEGFLEEFKVEDHDSSVAPFEENKLLKLYEALCVLKQQIENYPGNFIQQEALLQRVDELGDNLSKLTKKEVIHDVSTVLAKVKFAGVKAYKLVLDVGVKELIKNAIYGTINIAAN